MPNKTSNKISKDIFAPLFVLLILLIWNLLILLTPFLESRSEIYPFFSYFCHQIPSRSITPNDLTFGLVQNFYIFPVCTRDLAFYLFLLLGSIVFSMHRGITSKELPSLWWLVVAAIPMAIDGGTQWIGLRESTNLLRFLTGSLLGFVCAYYLIPLVNILIPRKQKGKQN